MLTGGGGGRINFGGAGGAPFFSEEAPAAALPKSPTLFRKSNRMAMSQSERIRLLQEAVPRTVSRNKCVDSSFLTMINQAKAASGSAVPVRVAAVIDRNDCATNVTIAGKGMNGEYFGQILAAQHCAVCPDNRPPDGGVQPTITIPTVCPNFSVQPWAQQNISTIYPAPYVAPCTDPGNRVYFPNEPLRGDSSNCTLPHLPYPSA